VAEPDVLEEMDYLQTLTGEVPTRALRDPDDPVPAAPVASTIDFKKGPVPMAVLIHVWAQRVIRAFGVVSLLMAAFGLALCSETALHFRGLNRWNPSEPYLALVFWVMTGINFVFLLALAAGGLLLLKLDRKGLRLCNTLFAAEILYWLGAAIGGLYLALRGHEWAAGLWRSFAGASGIGNMGIAPQILTFFPVIGLVVLNLAFRRLPRPVAPDLPPAQ